VTHRCLNRTAHTQWVTVLLAEVNSFLREDYPFEERKKKQEKNREREKEEDIQLFVN